MPDWTYQTVFRPLFRQLPFSTVIKVVDQTMGRLGNMPGGHHMIAFMGHMRPPKSLARYTDELPDDLHGVSPLGLGCDLVNEGGSAAAFSQMGVGYLEFGPLVYHEDAFRYADQVRHWKDEGFCVDSDITLKSSGNCLASLERVKNLCQGDVRRLVKVVLTSDQLSPDLSEAWHSLGVCADGVVLEVSQDIWLEEKKRGWLGDWLSQLSIPVFLLVEEISDATLKMTQDIEACGIKLLLNRKNQAIDFEKLKGNYNLIVSCPFHEPGDITALIESGVDIVLLDQGMVQSGPGLPKRCNQYLDFKQLDEGQATDLKRPAQYSWFWAFMIGLALFGGGVLAMGIALTRVLLPYDESMSGLTREMLDEINAHLIAFMRHDRVTLAGTMLSLGTLYMALAWHGMRQGMHWARVTFNLSVWTGFFSFFLFLGFGYFDPFHAFVAACLFVPMVVILVLDDPSPKPTSVALSRHINLRNTRSWHWAQWGQLLMVGHGVALIVAGLTICFIGVTSVFVPEDLDFMQTTSEHLHQAHPSLVPLVAHDRASFGGMLLSTGITVFLSSLWGIGQGRSWLWWSTLMAGLMAYVATLAIHLAVGYHHLAHLIPVYGGLAGLLLASCLLHGYCLRPEAGDKMG